MPDAELSKEEAAAMQEKLRKAGQNTKIFQQKVKNLEDMVESFKTKRQHALENIDRKKKELAEKDAKILALQTKLAPVETRLSDNKEKARRLKQQLAEIEASFGQIIAAVGDSKKRTAYMDKEVTTNHVSRELTAQRGYSCKAGSTANHIANIVKSGFF
mmetsp:Transcript_10958/g.27614  ORF Transcript_10958/g.27614 Transcript_10958/m.27614 type:complete len:159 (-) Transcript_10958:138-614(-)